MLARAVRPHGLRGPRAGPADNVDMTVVRDLFRTAAELAERDMHGVRRVTGTPLVVLAHIKKEPVIRDLCRRYCR